MNVHPKLRASEPLGEPVEDPEESIAGCRRWRASPQKAPIPPITAALIASAASRSCASVAIAEKETPREPSTLLALERVATADHHKRPLRDAHLDPSDDRHRLSGTGDLLGGQPNRCRYGSELHRN